MDRRLILPLFLLVALPLQAEVYKWTDANGNLHFGDAPPDKAPSQAVDIRGNTYGGTPETKEDAPGKETVTLYSTEWCGYCQQAKVYFHKKKIPFTEFDVEKSSRGRQEYKKMGKPGVPIILCGNKKMSGFSPKGFEAVCGTY